MTPRKTPARQVPKLPTIETERLLLRPFKLDDAGALFTIYQDPQVMRYVGKAPVTLADERNRLRRHIKNHYLRLGYGLLATVLKDTGAVIGRCGFLNWKIEGRQRTEVGYLLARAHWGQGLATEAAQALVHFGFGTLRKRRLISLIHPDNAASIRVALKIGMAYEKDVPIREKMVRMYSQIRGVTES